MKIFSILLCVGLTLASISHSDHESYRQRIPHAKSTNTTTKQPNFTLPQLLALQKKFLDAFMYPANVEQAKAINSTLVAEDVRGRVDITRTFVGRELNTEYLFGLFANLATSPGQISLLGVPLSYEILHFTGNQNIATVSTKIMFNFTSVNLVLPLRIDIWNTFNAAGQITQYDSSFIFWDWAVTTLLQAAAPIFKANSTEAVEATLQKLLAKSICETAMQSCNGTNEQYKSQDQCYQYLTETTRFGQPWELGRNTLLCRMVHQNMVPIRPDVHCSHIGPSGGGYCNDDQQYADYLNQNFFTNAPFVPAALVGKNQSVLHG